MPVKYKDLLAYKGANFSTTIYVTNPVTGNVINISGNTVVSKFRTSYYTANATGSFTCNVSNAGNGEITMTLTANGSNVRPGRYVYDVEINNSGVIERVQEGIMTIRPEASW